MSESGAQPTRNGRSGIIRKRHHAGPNSRAAISLIFALIVTPIVLLDSFTATPDSFVAGETARYTVRVPLLNGEDTGEFRVQGGGLTVARGELLTENSAATAAAVIRNRHANPVHVLGLGALLVMLTMVYTAYLRRFHRAKLLRTQILALSGIAATVLIVKLLLMVTPLSVLLAPAAAIALLATFSAGVGVGITTGLFCATVLSLLVPFDASVWVVLACQGCIAALIGRTGATLETLFAGVIGGAAAALAYLVVFVAKLDAFPLTEFADPVNAPILAALIGGVVSGCLALLLHPMLEIALGGITRAKLVELSDLSNPLLEQIASDAPGSWQHSLAMANMAEIASNAIGADGRLVRVGAYYHDLGKSLQSKYFIENLQPGEPSPHDQLDPHVSADAIFAHVTEGVRLGRERGLPEPIIDFMHMHHGDGRLEYFWSKCQEQGNPDELTEDDFRYPGVKPQSKETAILAIVDAVEAASRTLKAPDDKSVRTLVQMIVYGKLHLGQLDESGLTMADLRMISEKLVETIKHAYHGRIEYPWQKELRAEQKEEAEAEQAQAQQSVESVTSRIARGPRLDSLDSPPGHRPRRVTNNGTPPTVAPVPSVHSTIEVAKTQEVSAPPNPGDADSHESQPRPAAADS